MAAISKPTDAPGAPMDCGGMTCLPDRQAPLFLHAPPTVSALELSNTLEPFHRAAKAGTCPRSPKIGPDRGRLRFGVRGEAPLWILGRRRPQRSDTLTQLALAGRSIQSGAAR